MIFASGLGMVLSLVFGCLLLALIGELYYLLWWKSLPSKPPAGGTAANLECHLEEAALDKSKEAIVEEELMRIQSRLLSTISEETKEDLESEAGKSSRKGSRTRSMGDLILAVEESPLGEFQGFNPLFESALQGAEGDGLRCSSSPPPKMKFLKDAEEKLQRRLVDDGLEDGRDGSFVRILFRRDSNHS